MRNKLFIAITALTTALSFAQISSTQVDEVVDRSLKPFNVPGIAVAIIKDGKIIPAKGYGVKSILTNEKVKANALFGIASNSKAFTGAALAILADEGKLKWDNAYLHADAHLFFECDTIGKATRITMVPISELTDFS